MATRAKCYLMFPQLESRNVWCGIGTCFLFHRVFINSRVNNTSWKLFLINVPPAKVHNINIMTQYHLFCLTTPRDQNWASNSVKIDCYSRLWMQQYNCFGNKFIIVLYRWTPHLVWLRKKLKKIPLGRFLLRRYTDYYHPFQITLLFLGIALVHCGLSFW